MTYNQFFLKLLKIDFTEGKNCHKLEEFLRALLHQLLDYKGKEPTPELILQMLERARWGECEKVESFWHKISEMDICGQDGMPLDEDWRIACDTLRFYAADLIKTEEIRSHPDYVKPEFTMDFTTEKGITYYNGTYVSSLIAVSTEDIEMGEFPPAGDTPIQATWEFLTGIIIIGIVYE